MMEAAAGDDPPYMERQRLQHCLLHTLNALAGGPAFTAADLDALADALEPPRRALFYLPLPHPHRGPLGNWSVEVLAAALQRRLGAELKWHDARDAALERLDLNLADALVVNAPARSVLGALARPLGGGRHWYALRRAAGGAGGGVSWWCLDSHLARPRRVAELAAGLGGGAAAGEGAGAAEEAALRAWLRREVRRGGQVLTVVHGGLHPP